MFSYLTILNVLIPSLIEYGVMTKELATKHNCWYDVSKKMYFQRNPYIALVDSTQPEGSEELDRFNSQEIIDASLFLNFGHFHLNRISICELNIESKQNSKSVYDLIL